MAKPEHKKEEVKEERKSESRDNSLGIVAVVLGIMSIALSGGTGIFLGIVGLIFAVQQKKKHYNQWAKAGIILNFIGIVLGIILIVVFLTVFASNPDILSQFQIPNA